tara:strand:+ start:1616 stop:4177 length:2562 start_codon:yes stop_codon:yes gene_type:complete
MSTCNEAHIEYDLDILQQSMSSQGWSGGLLMHDHIDFFADTICEPRARISCRQVRIDDRRGTLALDRCEVMRYMRSSQGIKLTPELLCMKELAEHNGDCLVQNGTCKRYPYDLMHAALQMFTNRSGVCFVRILYRVKTEAALTNNFACTVPFVAINGSAVMQTAWNGCWWESLVDSGGAFELRGGKQFMSILSEEETDGNYAAMMSAFCDREVMSWASLLIREFLTLGRRDRGTSSREEMISLFNDMTYVEFCPMHIPIAHMHLFLKKKMPPNMVRCIMARVAQTGVLDVFETRSTDKVEAFKIDLLMAAIIVKLLEVEADYRPDYNGEDIGTRFDKVRLQDKDFESSLISGDDCEGMAQTFVCFEYSLKQEVATPGFAAQYAHVAKIMRAPENMRWRVYIARGTCLQSSSEQNHTFAVVLHKMTVGSRIHVLETVSSQVVVPCELGSDLKQYVSNLAPTSAVVDENHAQIMYQHVCVLDEFLCFEYANFRGQHRLHFGAACFFTYHKHFVVCKTDDENSAFSLFRDDCEVLQGMSGTDTRLLLLITQEAYMYYYKDLLNIGRVLGSRWKSIPPCHPPQDSIYLDFDNVTALNLFASGLRENREFSVADLKEMKIDNLTGKHIFYDAEAGEYYAPCTACDVSIAIDNARFADMMAYFQFTRLFTQHILNAMYRENTDENRAWVDRYFAMHPRSETEFDARQILALVCFVGNNQDSQARAHELAPCKINGALVEKIASKRQTLREISQKMSRLLTLSSARAPRHQEGCVECINGCASGDMCMLRLLQKNMKQIQPYFCGILEKDLGQSTGRVLSKLDELLSASVPSPEHYRALYHSVQNTLSVFDSYLNFNKKR